MQLVLGVAHIVVRHKGVFSFRVDVFGVFGWFGRPGRGMDHRYGACICEPHAYKVIESLGCDREYVLLSSLGDIVSRNMSIVRVDLVVSSKLVVEELGVPEDVVGEVVNG